METRDWSLVIFTVLTQAAVGGFITLQVLHWLSARVGATGISPNPGRRAPVPLVVVLAVLSVGLFAALFHLSTPLQAARAVVNFASSWLSREIVFGSLFAGLLSLLAWRERRAAGSVPASPAPERRTASAAAASPAPERRAAGSVPASPAPERRAASAAAASPTPAEPASANPAFRNPVAASPMPAEAALATWLPPLTAAAGLAFLCCQIAIYLLPAQPAWNSFATPAAFGGTALRLGILGVAAGFVVRNLTAGVDDPERADPIGSGGTWSATLRGLALAGLAALALEFVVVPLHLASLAANPLPAAAASVQRLTGDYGGILLLRLGLLGAAAAALGAVIAFSRGPAGPAGRSGISAHRLASTLTCGAFGLTVASEACGRFLFYAMQVRVGI